MIKKRQLLNKIDILKNISAEHKDSLKEFTIFEEIGSTNDVAKTKLTEIDNLNDYSMKSNLDLLNFLPCLT